MFKALILILCIAFGAMWLLSQFPATHGTAFSLGGFPFTYALLGVGVITYIGVKSLK